MENIKLTYDETGIKKNVNVSKKTDENGNIVVTTRTIVTLPCRFEGFRLNQEMEEFGFVTFPEGMKNILNRYGFKFNHKKGAWCGVSTGIAVHVATIKEDGTTIQDDEYSEEYGYNVALTKAKVATQLKALHVMYGFNGLFNAVADLFERSMEHFNTVYLDECDALDRVKKFGVCDPELCKNND